MDRKLLEGVLGLVLAFAMRAGATTDVHVAVVDPEGRPIPDATVIAEPSVSTGHALPGSLRSRAPNGRATLALEPGTWLIRSASPGRVGQTTDVLVAAAAKPSEVTLMMWTAGTLAGTLELPAGQSGPRELRATLRKPTPAGFGAKLFEHAVPCSMDRQEWACELPAGMPLDLELDASPYAPAYLWGVVAGGPAQPQRLKVTLFRGSSLAGWVVPSAGGQLPDGRATVQLLGSDGQPVAPPAGAAHRLTTTTDARGFFQLGPAPPGQYHVNATADARITEQVVVELAADKEQRLRSPLVLYPPSTLHVRVNPPQDPVGNPWLVNLITWKGHHRGHRVTIAEPVSAEGLWTRRGLTPGPYRLSLQTAGGGVWHDKELELGPGATDHEVNIEKLRVQGSVTVGGDPLVGHVNLLDVTTGVRAQFKVNEDGSFGGDFPMVDRARAWWSAEIRASTPHVVWYLRRLQPEQTGDTELRFEIELPGGRVAGRVVDEVGNPEGATVHASIKSEPGDEGLLHRLAGQSEASTGRFVLGGLAAGEYSVYASGPDGSKSNGRVSEAASVTIGSSAPADLVLTLRRTLEVKGRVITGSGTGVAGATLVVRPADRPDIGVPRTRTDADGTFKAKVPFGTHAVVIDAWAVGVGYKTLGRPLRAEESIQVVLDPAIAGTLLFDLSAPGATLEQAYLQHDGGFVPVGHLSHWSAQNGLQQETALRVPLVSPGRYRVCRLRLLAAQYVAFMSGALPAELCNEGVLPVGGELRLELPAPVAAARQ